MQYVLQTSYELIQQWMIEHPPLRFDAKFKVDKDYMERVRLPNMVEFFNSLLVKAQLPPTQSEYVAAYCEHVSNSNNKDNARYFLAAKARAQRAYPSFVRTIHFAILLNKLLETRGTAIISFALDFIERLDILVLHQNGSYLGLRLTVDTWWAKKCLDRKDGEKNNMLPHVVLTPDTEIGVFWVHSPSQATHVINKLESNNVTTRET